MDDVGVVVACLSLVGELQKLFGQLALSEKQVNEGCSCWRSGIAFGCGVQKMRRVSVCLFLGAM